VSSEASRGGGDTSTLFPSTIETDRLRLVRVDVDPLDSLTGYEHMGEGAPNIDETTSGVSWDPHSHPQSVSEMLTGAEGRAEDGEAGMFIVRPREREAGTDEFAGTTGLSVNWEKQRAVLGIWLRKPFWGRGYSGERADALLELAFARLDLDCISVSHLLDNEQSERAITKYVERHGGRREGTFRNQVTDESGAVHDVARYSITQSEWRQSDGAQTAVTFRT
jgi:RimJ/RimL family protein N-acetyltransferase